MPCESAKEASRANDASPLVEPRAADHLIGDLLPDQDILENPRLSVRAIEDADLGTRIALLRERCDLRGDEACFRVLVLDLDDAHRLTLPQLAPKVLRLPLAVVRNDCIRRAQDRVRGAVVLLERDHTGAAEVALELEDVADVRSAEGVDRLVGIADDEDVLVLAREQLEEAVLRVIRVLIFVDEHVAERLLPAGASLGEAVEHLHREHQQVVEVDGVRGVEPLLVEVVGVGDCLVVEGRDPGAIFLWADELILRHRDLRVDAARDEALRVAVEFLEDRLRQPDLVGLVVDGEVLAVAEPRRLLAEDAAAGRMKGHHPHRSDDAAEHAFEAALHLVGRLVCEGDGEDLLWLHAAGGDEVGDPVRQDARLARACAGDHEHGSLGGEHRLALGGIQVGEVGLRRGDGHDLDASARDRAQRTRLLTSSRALSIQPTACSSASSSADFSTTSTSGPSSRKRG
jgi:hypothetical protein